MGHAGHARHAFKLGLPQSRILAGQGTPERVFHPQGQRSTLVIVEVSEIATGRSLVSSGKVKSPNDYNGNPSSQCRPSPSEIPPKEVLVNQNGVDPDDN